jgi:A/G-specific adenine glycosylase
MKNKNFFLNTLLAWNETDNKREMPWKGEKDPYKIWISEIILQQTRVQQGLAYYNTFIKNFPDVKSLATASEQQVYKLWEGLGYYSRCRNLIASAKFINEKLAGKFPEKYEDILSLKGIGGYTASAIASFAFNQPYAVVDGNVLRILSRFFGIQLPIDSAEGKKVYNTLARGLIDKKDPAKYNQAIMDFGAIVCKPALPLCNQCPFRIHCIALKKDLINVLPIKEKSIAKKERFFNYLIIENKNKFYVRKRTGKDIWQNLFEFVLIETEKLQTEKDFVSSKAFTSFLPRESYSITKISKNLKQQLTHQTIHGRFIHIQLQSAVSLLKKYCLVTQKELDLLPFPKFINSYLQD